MLTSLIPLRDKRFIIVNIVFAITAFFIELAGTSTNMYFYAKGIFTIFGVPLIIVVYWVIIGHMSWIVYKNFGWAAGLLTGILIDLPFEYLAFQFGWWSWIPSWTPPIFFNAPVMNFMVYLSVSLGSIMTYKYLVSRTIKLVNFAFIVNGIMCFFLFLFAILSL